MSPTTSPFGPLAVLLDPRAGHGAVAREVDAVEHALEARGLEYRLHVGGTSEELRLLSTSALDEGYRFLAAVGDDGTVQDVVNGIFREGRPIVESPVLGVVAAHSGSDLPLSFGLPGDTERAIGHLAGADTYPFDLMKIAVTGPDGTRTVRYAHNVAEIGFHAAATIAASRGGARFHNLKRFAAFWRAYATTRVAAGGDRHRPADRRARCMEHRDRQRPVHRRGDRLSPRSFPGDGVLDGLVFTGPRSNAYRLLPRIFRHGDHVPDPSITEVHAKLKIDVTSRTPAACGRRRGRAGDHARHVPGGPATDPPQGLSRGGRRPRGPPPRRGEPARGRRRAARCSSRPRRDSPLPRWVRADAARAPHACSSSGPTRRPLLVVPALERPLAAAAPAAGVLELLDWRDDQDPLRHRGVADRRRRGDGLRGRPDLGIARARAATRASACGVGVGGADRRRDARTQGRRGAGRTSACRRGRRCRARRAPVRTARRTQRATRSRRSWATSWSRTATRRRCSRSWPRGRTRPRRTMRRGSARSVTATSSCSTSAGPSTATTATRRARSWWADPSERLRRGPLGRRTTPTVRRRRSSGRVSRSKRSTGRRDR